MKTLHIPISLPFYTFIYACFSLFIFFGCSENGQKNYINRLELVNRHNVTLNHIDTLGSLSVGNGDFAYTADITGMQTFPEAYERGVSLGTQSNWGWHSFPNDSSYSIDDVAVNYESCNNKSVPYAVQHSSGRAALAANYLRSNPHRMHLGIIGLKILNSKGEEILLDDIKKPKQKLNLWTGKIESYFEIDGTPVMVETVGHQEKDMVSYRISSSLIESNQLKIRIKFPYAENCHTCPGYDWEKPERHSSKVIQEELNNITIKRTLDTTTYFVRVGWQGKAKLNETKTHYFEIDPEDGQDGFECSVFFSQTHINDIASPFHDTEINSQQHWKTFWKSGGVIDFSDCTDPRASELERRVILSQYLTKIQCSGALPPQETGLTFNSWHGKFHIEMHWWHAVHFSLWDRSEYLENSLDWYFDQLGNLVK